MPEIIDPAAVFIDIQKHFCDPEIGVVDQQAADEIRRAIEATNAFLEQYRESGRKPIFVRVSNDDYTVSEVWRNRFEDRDNAICRADMENSDFVSGLDVRSDDLTVTKYRYNAFNRTNLETILSSNGISRLLLGGVMTNVCVESTARGAIERDYEVDVLSDCTAARTPEQHRRALERIDPLFGTTTRSTEIDLESTG